jgi:hypothetical protein
MGVYQSSMIPRVAGQHHVVVVCARPLGRLSSVLGPCLARGGVVGLPTARAHEGGHRRQVFWAPRAGRLDLHLHSTTGGGHCGACYAAVSLPQVLVMAGWSAAQRGYSWQVWMPRPLGSWGGKSFITMGHFLRPIGQLLRDVTMSASPASHSGHICTKPAVRSYGLQTTAAAEIYSCTSTIGPAQQ